MTSRVPHGGGDAGGDGGDWGGTGGDGGGDSAAARVNELVVITKFEPVACNGGGPASSSLQEVRGECFQERMLLRAHRALALKNVQIVHYAHCERQG